VEQAVFIKSTSITLKLGASGVARAYYKFLSLFIQDAANNKIKLNYMPKPK